MILDISEDEVTFGELSAGKVCFVDGDYYLKLEETVVMDKNQDLVSAVRIYDGLLKFVGDDVEVSIPRVCKVVIKQN